MCREITDTYELDVNTCYASIAGTTKHVGTGFVLPEHVTACLEMLHMVAGGEDKWRERPFVSQSNCFVVPPLKFAEDACRCLEVAARGGMPVLLLSAGQAGATAPAALAGTVVQATAECLAGLVYLNAIVPGAVGIFGTWPFVSDLRTGAMSGGSPEQALISAACGQMAQFYDLCGGTGGRHADAKLMDFQAGYETATNLSLVGNAGTNLIYEAAGMHASLLGVCKETPGPRQRHHRRGAAHHARHRGERREPLGGDDPRGLRRGARSLSRLAANAGADADATTSTPRWATAGAPTSGPSVASRTTSPAR